MDLVDIYGKLLANRWRTISQLVHASQLIPRLLLTDLETQPYGSYLRLGPRIHQIIYSHPVSFSPGNVRKSTN